MKIKDENELVKSFSDAGCSESSIKEALKNINNNERLINILITERKKRLEKVHGDEKMLQCIDYLLFKLKEEK